MKKKHSYLPFLYFLLLSTSLLAQKKYPQNYFLLPFQNYVGLSGVFSELRPNHFHSGIDFRTNGEIEIPVHSVADGYVSRIKVSAVGGGKALYVNHPNHYKSVFMHLDQYVGEIDDFVKKYQYQNHVYEFDIAVDSTLLPIKKGQLVALSGNTGSSQGPHLHFEIRETANDKTINPLFFGFNLCDQTSPEISEVRIYPANDGSLLAGKNQPISLIAKDLLKKQMAKKAKKGAKKQPAKKNTYAEGDTLEVFGNFYFGISSTDELCSSSENRGIYSLEVSIDSQRVYSHCIEEFMFEDTRYANAMIDYPFYLKTRKRLYLTKLPAYTPIPIYNEVKNGGIYNFDQEKISEIKIKSFDFAGNSTSFVFYLKVMPSLKPQEMVKNTGTVLKNPFYFNKPNSYERKGLSITMNPLTLYNTIDFKCSVVKKTSKLYQPLCYQIHTSGVPLHKAYNLKITANSIPTSLRAKAVIVSVLPRVSAESTQWQGNFLVANPTTFGLFSIAIDTVPPKVTPIFKPAKALKADTKFLSVKMNDNLSGIAAYNCFLNSKWILAAYDEKRDLLNIEVLAELVIGENELIVEVEDFCKNKTQKSWTLTVTP